MFDNDQYDYSEEEIIDVTLKQGSQSKLVFKQNDELVSLIAICEIHSKSKCSETEDVKVSIIATLLTCLTLSKHVMSDGFKYLLAMVNHFTEFG